MKNYKLKEEELESLKLGIDKLELNYKHLGIIDYQILLLEGEKIKIAQEITEIANSENDLLNSYTKEYGEGEIDLNKGEFTTIE